MSEASGPITGKFLSKQRLEALSDGVFAVALTLLVLELKLDHLPMRAANEQVLETLHELARPFISYILTFVLSSIFWVLQHRKFLLLARTTVRHAALTLVFLFFVSLLPLSVSIFFRANKTAAGNLVYFANMAGLGLSLLAGWLEARRDGLVEPDATEEDITLLTRRITAMTVGATAAAVTSLFRPELSAIAMGVAAVLVRLAFRKKPVVAS